jgi:hypothetical protein
MSDDRIRVAVESIVVIDDMPYACREQARRPAIASRTLFQKCESKIKIVGREDPQNPSMMKLA